LVLLWKAPILLFCFFSFVKREMRVKHAWMA
jgi:hypothetical protein